MLDKLASGDFYFLGHCRFSAGVLFGHGRSPFLELQMKIKSTEKDRDAR
jgi:hypothetical protein